MSASETGLLLPWRITEHGEVVDANGRTVEANGFASVMNYCDAQVQSRARSAFIVEAVNAYGRTPSHAVHEPDRRLYDEDEFMADGEIEMTAAEDALAWLLIEKIGCVDDVNYTPKNAREIIAARLDLADELESAPSHAALLAEVEILRADAARYRYLKEHCSYHAAMTWEQPAEWSIGWEFQQSTPAEAYGSFDKWIDADIVRAAMVDAKNDEEDRAALEQSK